MDDPIENVTDDDLVRMAEEALEQDDPVAALEYCEQVLDRSPDCVPALLPPEKLAVRSAHLKTALRAFSV